MTIKRDLDVDPNSIMTLGEVARYLHTNPRTVRRLLREEHLPGFKVARGWHFQRVNIDRWRLGQSTERK
jgi:excisionase family DNA binding protein